MGNRSTGYAFEEEMRLSERQSTVGSLAVDVVRNWHKLRIDDLVDLKPIPGVYVIYCDGVLSYVGSTNNLQARLFKHLCYGHTKCVTQWGLFDDVFIKIRLSRKYGDWAMIELRLIARLQPKFNRVHLQKCRTGY